MSFPLQFCRLSTAKPLSISSSSTYCRSSPCPLLRLSSPTNRLTSWKQDRILSVQLPPIPKRRVVSGSTGESSRGSSGPKSGNIVKSIGSKAIFAVTITGVISSEAMASCLSYLKELAAGGGNGGGEGGGDGGGDGGDSGNQGELFQLSVQEEDNNDDRDDEEDEEDEDEDEDEEDDDFEEGEIEEFDDDFEEGEIEEFDDDIDEEDYVDPSAPFECGKVSAVNLPVGPGVPRDVDLFAGLHCQSGFRCSQEELRKDLKTLTHTEGIEHVEIRVTPVKGTKGKKCDVSFIFKSIQLPELKSFQVKGASAIPEEVIGQVMEMYKKDFNANPDNRKTSIETIGMMRHIVEKWYQDRGYIMCYIRNFSGLFTGDVTANLVEGRINQVKVTFVDDEGNEKKKGNCTPPSFVKRELSFVPGQLYNQEDSRRALRDLIGTGMYENVQVLPEQTRKDEKLIDVTVMVKERPMKTTEIELDWQVRRQNGLPLPESIVPGATILIDNRNLFNGGHSLTGTVTTSNLLDPRDIGYKIEWRKPYIFGENDKQQTALSGIMFNARRISGVFTAGPTGEEVPPVFVHRSGAKIALQEQYSCNSRGSLGIVAQEIVTYDDSGTVVSRGFRNSTQGDGPPTTLGEGQDQQIYVQANIVRDTTYIVNGTPIGARDIYLVDQGTGIGGLFNRQIASITRFLKLRNPVGFKPPPVLVLHGKFGNAIGDLASYDAFCLGGPHSVRGVNLGELGTCRAFLEMAAELRLPTPFANQHMYAFYEYGTDLGSSKCVPGNPTVYFRKPGSGATTGFGLKIGPSRIEYSRDLNLGKGSFMLNIGERF